MDAPRWSAFQTPPAVDMCAPNFTKQARSSSATVADPCTSEFVRFTHQRSNTRQQSTGRTAIEHPMIETQRQIRFGDRYKLALLFVPTRDAATRAQTQHQRLFGERNGCGQRQTECAKIRHCGNGTACRARRKLALAG